jgi:hypothetical protein
MWTTENRRRYDRDKLRYPSDLTDAEWQHIEPLIPPAKRGGGKRTVDMREVVNGVMYVLSTGCQWRYIPKDLPPRSTVNGVMTVIVLLVCAASVAGAIFLILEIDGAVSGLIVVSSDPLQHALAVMRR